MAKEYFKKLDEEREKSENFYSLFRVLGLPNMIKILYYLKENKKKKCSEIEHDLDIYVGVKRRAGLNTLSRQNYLKREEIKNSFYYSMIEKGERLINFFEQIRELHEGDKS